MLSSGFKTVVGRIKRWNWESMRGVVIAGLIVTAAVMVGVFALHLESRTQVDTSLNAPATSTPRTEDARKRVVVIGDSISSGTPTNRTTWVRELAQRNDWTSFSTAQGGAGFVSGEQRRRNYLSQLSRALRSNPDLLVVAASTNDRKYLPEDVRDAASSLLRDAKAARPSARLLVVGPFNSAPQPAPDVAAVNAAVAAACASENVPFINLLETGWRVNTEWLQPDGVNLNDEGQIALADLLDPMLTER